MKFAISASAACFIVVASLRAMPKDDVPISPEDLQRVTELIHRYNATNDPDLFLEIATLPAPASARMLALTALDQTTNPDHAARALVALRTVKGLGQYFRTRIEALHRTYGANAIFDDFTALALIANEEAAFAAAPFLFDDSPGVEASDYSVSGIRWQAAAALNEMRLPDGLPWKTRAAFREDDIKKWREWAIEKKLVAPATPKASEAPLATQEVTPPPPLPQPAPPIVAKAASATRARTRWPLVGIIVGVVAGVIATAAFIRRKHG